MIDITTMKIYNLYVKLQITFSGPALSWVFFAFCRVGAWWTTFAKPYHKKRAAKVWVTHAVLPVRKCICLEKQRDVKIASSLRAKKDIRTLFKN
nr:hypothetical protein [Sporomusa silvacetica]